MNKKFFFLIISWVLVASCGLYAQSSEFVLEDEDVDVTVQPIDTVAQEPESIPVTQKNWEYLEQPLKDEIITLSKDPTKNKVSRKNIAWIYQVDNVPTSIGRQTVYLSILKDGVYGFFLSKEDPNSVDEVCECYLDLQLPEKIKASPSKHQTDDESFGQPNSNGKNIKIENSPLFGGDFYKKIFNINYGLKIKIYYN